MCLWCRPSPSGFQLMVESDGEGGAEEAKEVGGQRGCSGTWFIHCSALPCTMQHM